MSTKRPSILLTGDDGYCSVGTRLLIHYLRGSCDLAIAGTLKQQSGAGGKVTMTGGTWGEAVVDGTPALWVDGSPYDSIEAATQYYKHPFDLVISGMNFGLNVAGAVYSSGTVAAAFIAVNVHLAPRAIAVSWDVSPDMYYKKHTPDEPIDMYIDHPGSALRDVILTAMSKDYWGSPLLNINIPSGKPVGTVFAPPHDYTFEIFPPVHLDFAAKTYSFPGEHMNPPDSADGTDFLKLRQGYVTITPCQRDIMHREIYGKLAGHNPMEDTP